MFRILNKLPLLALYIETLQFHFHTSISQNVTQLQTSDAWEASRDHWIFRCDASGDLSGIRIQKTLDYYICKSTHEAYCLVYISAQNK